MSASSPDANIGAVREHEAPYPSWSSIADELGTGRVVADQDCQALKEARIWRALAEETSTEGTNRAAGSDNRSAPAVRA